MALKCPEAHIFSVDSDGTGFGGSSVLGSNLEPHLETERRPWCCELCLQWRPLCTYRHIPN